MVRVASAPRSASGGDTGCRDARDAGRRADADSLGQYRIQRIQARISPPEALVSHEQGISLAELSGKPWLAGETMGFNISSTGVINGDDVCVMVYGIFADG